MSHRVLLGVVVALVLGSIAHSTQLPPLLALVTVSETVGTVWINAILSTVILLVVSSLIVGIASSSDTRFVGRLGRRAALWFLVCSAVSAAIAALLAPLLLARLPLDAAMSASLRARAVTAPVSSAAVPSVREWLIGLVPSNIVKAAADGAMLPLVIFTIAFALALTRVEGSLREAVLRFFEGVSAAVRELVGWILALAPVGVFALTFAFAARLGLSAAGALAYYVALAASLSVVLTLVLYPATALAARISLFRFARAAAPAQAVAFGSRSSLASLPALLHGAERGLGVPSAVAGFALPVAVATFKFSGPAAILVGVFFTARLYDVSFGPFALAQATVMALVLSFAVPGVPGGWLLIAATSSRWTSTRQRGATMRLPSHACVARARFRPASSARAPVRVRTSGCSSRRPCRPRWPGGSVRTC